MTDTTSLIVAPDSDIASAGKIVMWALSGPTNRTELQDAWDLEGLPSSLKPSDFTQPALSLQNALRELARGKRSLVRPLRQRGAWCVIDEVVFDSDVEDGEAAVTGEDLEHTTSYKAWIERTTNSTGASTIHLRLKDADDATSDAVHDAFTKHREHMAANTFSAWLTKVIEDCTAAVKIRKSGGVYYVPEDRVPVFDSIVSAITTANPQHVFHTITAMKADNCVATVLDAVNREAAELVDAIENELDTGDLGKRALNSRRGNLAKLGDKLASYETLLGSRLDDIKNRLEDVDVALGEAILLDVEASNAIDLLANAQV